MDEPVTSVDEEVTHLRDALSAAAIPPLGLTSRLEAAVRARIRSEGVGWEPRLVIACVAFAATVGGSAEHALTAVLFVALGSGVYSRFAVGVYEHFLSEPARSD